MQFNGKVCKAHGCSLLRKRSKLTICPAQFWLSSQLANGGVGLIRSFALDAANQREERKATETVLRPEGSQWGLWVSDQHGCDNSVCPLELFLAS
ncbi:hypothetical protein [uncultured Roseobacter sp.]|uniref:hypothetical protein n=1 Tax=uncultured Roseobacter sp. TaxID=114847 RepID=UPI00262886F9|nr:hypothetical protein [uncultured Roseobacter sp.]